MSSLENYKSLQVITPDTEGTGGFIFGFPIGYDPSEGWQKADGSTEYSNTYTIINDSYNLIETIVTDSTTLQC